MFGYITLNRPEAKVKHLELYRSYYCGLCGELKKRHGTRGQLLLSYDCTFLIVLLSGVYEPEEKTEMKRCVRHPEMKHPETVNRFTPYAADMNVLLGYLKAADDWKDEKKPQARLILTGLRKDYQDIRKMWPGQEREIRHAVLALSEEEKKEIPKKKDEILRELDKAAGCSGRFLGRILAPYRDVWEKDLYSTGFYLGKFIYIMDAYNDIEKDRKSGNYNLLSALEREDPEGFRETVKAILMDTAACCCRSFERLPVVKNVDILRNILYSGIWVKFNVRSV